MARRTVVVSARPQFEAVRLELARAGTGGGARVTPIDGLAARLAGGLLTSIDPDDLARAVSAALADTSDPVNTASMVKKDVDSTYDPGLNRLHMQVFGIHSRGCEAALERERREQCFERQRLWY